MKKILLLTTIVLLLSSCIPYSLSYYDTKTLTLCGQYVVSKLDATIVDQNQSKDSLYTIGSTYINPLLPDPFDTIQINRFYIHFDYDKIMLKFDVIKNKWEYNEISYRIIGNNSLMNAYLQFDYVTTDSSYRTLTFLIEDDGLESLQLKSSGIWPIGKFGEKQVI